MSINKIKLLAKLLIFLIISACGNDFFKKVDTRQRPVNAQERARQNVEQGKGISLKNVFKRGENSFEFSSSNPLWRATLEILDFLPLTTVDYSGGIIITDWYSDSIDKNGTSLKITVRFLSNDIQTNSVRIIVHQKKCSIENNCSTREINSKIKEELLRSILAKAILFDTEDKKKK